MAYSTRALSTVPVKSQGRKRPQRLRVLATTTPMKGSFRASNTRAIIRIRPTKVALRPSTS